MTTRLQIRRRAVGLVPRKGFSTVDGVNSLTASGGAVGTLIDTSDLPTVGASTALFANQRLWRPNANNAADVVRLITGTGYAASSQTITHGGGDYTEAPTAGTDDGVYLIVKDDPNLWNRAINEALRTECFFIQHDDWTPTDGTTRVYDISAAPISLSDILRISDIHGMEWHSTTDAANEEFWRDWDDGRREWVVFEDSGTIYIDFRHVLPTTTQEMRIISTQPYATLTDETTSIAVDEEWAANATVLIMSRWLGASDADWRDAGPRAQAFVRDRRRQELGRYAFRTVGRETQFGGAASVGGRGGNVRTGTNRRTFHN